MSKIIKKSVNKVHLRDPNSGLTFPLCMGTWKSTKLQSSEDKDVVNCKKCLKKMKTSYENQDA